MFFFLQTSASVALIILPLLLAVAYLTLLERKVIGSMQRRRGPNVVGYFGLSQPLADGLKLLLKETVLPSSANSSIFILAPIITFMLSLLGWAVIPLDNNMVFADIGIGLLYVFAVSSLGVHGILLSGRASNSKYAFPGSLRSAAQMVPYEVSIGFIIIGVVPCTGPSNLHNIVLAQQSVPYFIPLFPFFLMFFISALAETNRHPFDSPEAEAESVAGYLVEYSAMGFALSFLGESANILFMCALTSILSLGGWFPFLSLFNFIPGFFLFPLKLRFILFLSIRVRVAFPRYRYDQSMRLGRKIFSPLSLAFLLIVSGIPILTNSLPL